MLRTVSNSGPLPRWSAVLVLCILAACVDRRADGRRGIDATDNVDSTADTIRKVDTGIAAPKQPSGTVAATGSNAVTPAPTPPLTAPPTVAPVPALAPAPTGSAHRDTSTIVTQSDLAILEQRHPIVPISGIAAAKLPDTFNELRGGTRKHEALDILAPRGTPVHSADDGTVIKLFTSTAGGLTVYVAGPAQHFVYYYAHLDSYANGLAEGQTLHKGDVLGYVGSSGNADANVPHLHFGIARNDNMKEWWKGDPVNPTTVLQAAAAH